MVRPASFFRKLRERKINNDALLRLRQSRIKLPITRFIRNRSAKKDFDKRKMDDFAFKKKDNNVKERARE